MEMDRSRVAYPKDHRFSVKQIAYMHVYCRDEVRDIVSRYPRTLTMSHVHFALGHYFSNKEAIDEEIKRDLEFDRRRSLDAHSMTLPSRATLLKEMAEIGK